MIDTLTTRTASSGFQLITRVHASTSVTFTRHRSDHVTAEPCKKLSTSSGEKLHSPSCGHRSLLSSPISPRIVPNVTRHWCQTSDNNNNWGSLSPYPAVELRILCSSLILLTTPRPREIGITTLYKWGNWDSESYTTWFQASLGSKPRNRATSILKQNAASGLRSSAHALPSGEKVCLFPSWQTSFHSLNHWGISRHFCKGFCGSRIKSILLLCFTYASIIARCSVPCCCISFQIFSARSPETLFLFCIPINPC